MTELEIVIRSLIQSIEGEFEKVRDMGRKNAEGMMKSKETAWLTAVEWSERYATKILRDVISIDVNGVRKERDDD